MMRLLVVGSGGREHALTWKISQAGDGVTVVCAPGSDIMATIAPCRDVSADDLDGLVRVAQTESIDLVVVGPEVPLVNGLIDRLNAVGIAGFGPSAAAARLEGSKSFTKALCKRHGIPTAEFATFSAIGPAIAYVRERGAPIVVKADGLAAGKGVVVAHSVEDAELAIEAALGDGVFGRAGAELVVEEFLEGMEASFFALVDGKTAVPFGSARDFKRVGEGDAGPNTGGMGAVSPSPDWTPALEAAVMDRIIRPTVAAMRAEGAPFKGVLYAGLMLCPAGADPDGVVAADGRLVVPKLIEFNTRFGDPECQVLMRRFTGDLPAWLMATAQGRLDALMADADPTWRDDWSVVVVMAANGYPGAYKKGTPIGTLDAMGQIRGIATPSIVTFHAGTRREDAGGWRANGGRVLGVTALGATRDGARESAHDAVDRIDWPGGFRRRDVG